jgi:hypothetical protein
MLSEEYSDTTFSLALSLSAGAWGLYWFPLRTIENVGISGSGRNDVVDAMGGCDRNLTGRAYRSIVWTQENRGTHSFNV